MTCRSLNRPSSAHWAVCLPASDESFTLNADANSTLPPQSRAGCWRLTMVCSQHLDKRHSMTRQFNHETPWIFFHSHPSYSKHSNMLTVIPWYPFLLQLIELCKSEVFLILSLCSSLSSSSLTQASKPTQQITNWCLAWEAALCLPMAAWVKSLLWAQLDCYDHRCWSQYRSRELMMRYTWVWVREAEKKAVKRKKLTQVS